VTALDSVSAVNGRRSNVLSIALWVVALYFLLPLVWLAVASTKSNADLFSTFGYAFGRTFAFFDNVVNVFAWSRGDYGRWLLNTLIYALVSAVGGGARTMAAIMVPTTALAIPTYLLFAGVGMTNTPFAIILPSLVSPFAVYLMRIFAADAVSPTLLEAARIDGASEMRIFFQIGLPLLGPGIVTVFLFTLVATWNNYFLPLIMLSDDSLYPVTVGLAQWRAASMGGGSTTDALYANVVTGSFLSVVPLIVAFLFLQRYWVSGLSAGSVKE
jgi:multiple sugar transport system permease protein